MKKAILLFVTFFCSTISWTQNLQFQGEIPSSCSELTMTMLQDRMGRPYLYIAHKEAGLTIYNISDLTNPFFEADVPVSNFNNLRVMNLEQVGNYLYLAIGDHFLGGETAGMAIIDITSPTNPVVMDFIQIPGSGSGAGIVEVEGDYAYLGAMQSGLVIIDCSDKNNIFIESQFIFSNTFPPVNNIDTPKYNARGIEVRNDTAFVCYDAGGIRVLDCTDKSNPVEIGTWCTEIMYSPWNMPRAYNNIILEDTLAYVAVDYAGVEVLDISDPTNIEMVSWWNPQGAPYQTQWNGARIHTNEIGYDPDCKRLFFSTGKSDLIVLDNSDPTQLDSVAYYGGMSNSIGTWGVDVYQNNVYLSYVCVPWSIPFPSNATMIKILSYDPCFSRVESHEERDDIKIQVTDGTLLITTQKDFSDVRVYSISGQQVATSQKQRVDVGYLASGIYIVEVYSNRGKTSKKIYID